MKLRKPIRDTNPFNREMVHPLFAGPTREELEETIASLLGNESLWEARDGHGTPLHTGRLWWVACNGIGRN